jgi:hypothetical protein
LSLPLEPDESVELDESVDPVPPLESEVLGDDESVLSPELESVELGELLSELVGLPPPPAESANDAWPVTVCAQPATNAAVINATSNASVRRATMNEPS